MALDLYNDYERLGLAAHWADDAASKLVAARNHGLVYSTNHEGQDILDALYDGLMVISETLGAMTLPYPPPAVPPPRSRLLRVVK